jgi:DNA-binding protein YbaB
MAFDVEAQAEQAERLRQATRDDLAGAVLHLQRVADGALREAEQITEELATARSTVTAANGAVAVEFDGTGAVVGIRLDERWAVEAGGQRVAAAVAEALAEPDTGDDDAGPTLSSPRLVEYQATLRALRQRLAAARVKAAAPEGGIEVVFDGLGRAVEVTIPPDAPRRYGATALAKLVTTAVRSGQRAAGDLAHGKFEDARVAELSAAGLPVGPIDAAAVAARAFGTRA